MKPRHVPSLAAVCALLTAAAPRAAPPGAPEDGVPAEVRQQMRRLTSDDAKERAAAASRLSAMRQKAAPAAPLLIKLLTDQPPTQHKNSVRYGTPAWWAMEALTGIGAPAVPLLLEALKDENELVVARAAHVLGRIGDPRPRNKLLALLDDKSPVVRARAALAVCRTGRLDSLAPVLAAATDPHPLVQRYALDGLTMARDARAFEPLLALFEDPKYSRKGGVARALGALKDKRAVEPLIAALKGTMRHAPWHAAWALAEIGDPRAAEPLMALLDHPNDSAKVAAMRALLKLGGPGVYAAITRLLRCKGPHAEVRRLASQKLAKAGPPAAPAVAARLDDDDRDVQEAAAETLTKIYGLRFSEEAREQFAWRRDFLKKLAALEDLESVQSKLAGGAEKRTLVQAAQFSIAEQTQVLRFRVAGGRVFASVRYRAGTMPSPVRRTARPLMVADIRSALAAWDLDGKLLWKTDLPLAYHLLVVGGQVVLAYDDGALHSERGLIWVDAATGKVIRRILLPGRPGSLALNLASESLVMILYPQARLTSVRGSWMEVRSYTMAGKLAWARKEPVSELRGLSLGGGPVVVWGSGLGEPFVAGLDAATGKVLWRRTWERGSPPIRPPKGQPPKTLKGLVCVAHRGAIEFVVAETGEPRHVLPRPRRIHVGPKLCGHADRLYFTANAVEGYTLAALDFATSKWLWADRPGSVCHVGPTAWGGDVVFLTRRLSKGRTGHVTHTDLRIYAPDGTLRCRAAKWRAENQGYWDDTVQPQAVGHRLYVVDTTTLMALEWNGGGD